jgi:hypothetical protein
VASVTYQPVELSVNAIQAPTTGNAGVPLSLAVVVVLPDGCTLFDRLEVATDDMALRVVVTAHGREAQNVFCTQRLQSLTFRTVAATFTPARAGLYHVSASQGEGTATIDVR